VICSSVIKSSFSAYLFGVFNLVSIDLNTHVAHYHSVSLHSSYMKSFQWDIVEIYWVLMNTDVGVGGSEQII
jgi:hypothetical protein